MDEKITKIIVNQFSFVIFRLFGHVATIEETILKIRSSECSMARFGDGELKVLWGGVNCFQRQDVELAGRLKKILKEASSDSLLVCIPNINEKFRINTDEGKWFWNGFIRKNGLRWTKSMNLNGRYYCADVTRFYLGLKDKSIADKWFAELKEIWTDKDILIVEGSESKIGIGNDLFSNSKSIKRIIAPAHSAFEHYDEILEKVKCYWNGELVLIALGPTATVLAYDLSKQGIRALDVGHVDSEYVWWQMKATKRVRIPGKHTAELPDDEIQDSAIDEKAYLSEIIERII